MRKINIRLLGAAAALTAALAGAPSAWAATSAPHSSSSTREHSEVIRLVARQTQSAFVDLGRKGVSLGDERVIAEDLYQGDRKIGDHSVVCTYVHLAPDALQCVGAFALPQGQIAGQALLHLPAPPAVDIPVTGGSGAYRTAGGYVHTVPAGDTERHLTFHITR
ncbi:hypothetical protein [Streptomyces sp. NPDC001380]|uniref:allene oxide cyclase barrel-like domain-containing protein n=1 Tax=Streptomyces sp. NPDC001380 TaxID=3364566 RepID=UPI00368FF505